MRKVRSVGVSARAFSRRSAQQGQVVLQQAFAGRARLAGWQMHLFQAAAAIVADVEVDRVAVPDRFGRQSPQPAEEDLGVGVGPVEHGHARLDGHGPIVAGLIRQIDTNESCSHGSITQNQ